MSRFLDLTGLSYGNWTVQHRGSDGPQGQPRWWCLCACGTTKLVFGQSLRRGTSISCGCVTRLTRGSNASTHRMRKSPEYRIWAGMKNRCLNPNNHKYAEYGGRGIVVCERWLTSFQLFYEDMGPRPTPQHTLDRYPDQNGPYSKENCRWATPTEQGRNKRNNRLITIDGRTAVLTEWLHTNGIIRETFFARIKRGWTVEKAITTPPNPRNQRSKRHL